MIISPFKPTHLHTSTPLYRTIPGTDQPRSEPGRTPVQVHVPGASDGRVVRLGECCPLRRGMKPTSNIYSDGWTQSPEWKLGARWGVWFLRMMCSGELYTMPSGWTLLKLVIACYSSWWCKSSEEHGEAFLSKQPMSFKQPTG